MRKDGDISISLVLHVGSNHEYHWCYTLAVITRDCNMQILTNNDETCNGKPVSLHMHISLD